MPYKWPTTWYKRQVSLSIKLLISTKNEIRFLWHDLYSIKSCWLISKYRKQIFTEQGCFFYVIHNKFTTSKNLRVHNMAKAVSPLSMPWLKLKSVNPHPVVCGFFPDVFHLSYQAYIHHRISYTKAVTNFYLLFHPPCNILTFISIFLPLFHSRSTWAFS